MKLFILTISEQKIITKSLILQFFFPFKGSDNNHLWCLWLTDRYSFCIRTIHHLSFSWPVWFVHSFIHWIHWCTIEIVLLVFLFVSISWSLVIFEVYETIFSSCFYSIIHFYNILFLHWKALFFYLKTAKLQRWQFYC